MMKEYLMLFSLIQTGQEGQRFLAKDRPTGCCCVGTPKLGVTQAYRQCHHSIERIRLPIRLNTNYTSIICLFVFNTNYTSILYRL